MNRRVVVVAEGKRVLGVEPSVVEVAPLGGPSDLNHGASFPKPNTRVARLAVRAP